MKIVPAILTDNKEDLILKLKQSEQITDLVQIDIMDSIFVPSKSINYQDFQGIQTSLTLEVHLMVQEPLKYIEGFKQIGAKRIIFHYEPVKDNIHKILSELKNLNLEKGIAINPETSINDIIPYLSEIEVILLLAVNPGFYGSPFIPEVLDKAKELKKILTSLQTKPVLALDGGVKLDNVLNVIEAGIEQIVIGSAIFKGDPVENFNKFKEKITNFNKNFI